MEDARPWFETDLTPRPVRTAAVVAFVLIVLLVAASIFALIIRLLQVQPLTNMGAGPLYFVLPTMWLVTLVVVFVLRGVAVSRLRGLAETLDAQQRERLAEVLPRHYASLSIVCAVLLEGPGLLGALATIWAGELALLAAPAASVVGLLAVLPTRARLDRFAEAVLSPSAQRSSD